MSADSYCNVTPPESLINTVEDAADPSQATETDHTEWSTDGSASEDSEISPEPALNTPARPEGDSENTTAATLWQYCWEKLRWLLRMKPYST